MTQKLNGQGTERDSVGTKTNVVDLIDEEDRVFCQRHQEGFDKSYIMLSQIAELMKKAREEQNAIFGFTDENTDNLYLNRDVYHTRENFICDEAIIYEKMKERNENFIVVITDYFAKKYKIEIDCYDIIENILSEVPDSPPEDCEVYDFSQMTDGEREVAEAEIREYESVTNKREQMLRNFPMRYERVIEEIFAQMGGLSLSEYAKKNLIDKCRNLSHRWYWRTKSYIEDFTVKGNLLRLTSSNWCNYDDVWDEWVPTGNLQIILDALAMYECGKAGSGKEMFPWLFKYRTKIGEFYFNDLEKVKSVMLYKNGHVNIRFQNADYAQEFTDTYIKKPAETEDDVLAEF